MYCTNFERCFDVILGHEGGYVNDPEDPGGETIWGISKRAYPHLNIRILTRDGAKQIYRKDYWEKMRCDELPNPVAFNLFDAAVNHGCSRATMLLQQALDVADDGVLGPVTVSSANTVDVDICIMRFNAFRLAFYVKLTKWSRFGAGWTSRVSSNMLMKYDSVGVIPTKS